MLSAYSATANLQVADKILRSCIIESILTNAHVTNYDD